MSTDQLCGWDHRITHLDRSIETREISRLVGKVQNRSKGWEATSETLNWFFGNENWEDLTDLNDLLYHYIENIIGETTRKVVLNLPVKGPRGFRYDIILATKRTRKGNPWIKPMEELQDIMGGYRPEIVKRTLDILMKRQLSLNQVF